MSSSTARSNQEQKKLVLLELRKRLRRRLEEHRAKKAAEPESPGKPGPSVLSPEKEK